MTIKETSTDVSSVEDSITSLNNQDLENITGGVVQGVGGRVKEVIQGPLPFGVTVVPEANLTPSLHTQMLMDHAATAEGPESITHATLLSPNMPNQIMYSSMKNR